MVISMNEREVQHQRISLFRDILAVLGNHVAILTIPLTVMGIAGRERSLFFLWLGMALVGLGLWWMRNFIRRLIVFLFSVAILPVGGFFLSERMEIFPRIVFLIFLIGYCLFAYVQKFRQETDSERILMPIPALCLMGVANLAEVMQGIGGYQKYYGFCMLFYFGFYSIWYYFSRYQYFLITNSSSAADIPERAIFRAGLRQTILFVGVGILIFLLAMNVEWVTMLLRILREVFAAVLRFLLSGGSGETEQELIRESMQGGGGGFPPMDTEYSGPFWLWVALEYLMMTAVVVGLLFAVGYGLYRGIRYLIRNFRFTKREAVEWEGFAHEDVRERIEVSGSRENRGGLFSYFTNEQRVRRQFRKTVWKGRSHLIGDREGEGLNFLTSKECCEKLGEEQLRSAYERVRYGK